MKRKVNIIVLTLMLSNAIHAQKRKIILSEDLLENAIEMKVKWKSHNKSMEFFCGDYTMVESENKLGKTEEVFFTDIKEESWHSEFWFLMKNGDGHSAKVTSMTNGTSKSIDKSTLLDILTGEDDTYEVTEAKNLKTVTITTNFGAENEWVLKREYSYDNGEKELKITFDNGHRVIDILIAKPIKGGKYVMTSPALGFEFFEKGQSLAAYQSQGGAWIGLGTKQQLIWLRKNLDDETKLVLIAVMAAL